MTTKQPSVFVERRTYRRRRAADAARLLPLLGAMLLCMPMLWGSPGGEGAKTVLSTTSVMTFLFGTWVVLIVLASFVSAQVSVDDESIDDASVGHDSPTAR